MVVPVVTGSNRKDSRERLRPVSLALRGRLGPTWFDGADRDGNGHLAGTMGVGSMTAAGPVRDSVLNALGYAIGVLTKPRYWWAPTLITTITVLPLLALPGMPGMPGMGFVPGADPFGAGAPFQTRAEMEAYFQTFLPVLAATGLLAIVLTPVVNALAYRLAVQYANGEAAVPFGPGFVDLAWRFFLQTLAFIGLFLGGFLLFALLFLVGASTGSGLVILLTFIAWFVVAFFFVVRLAVAPALLVSGLGPVESITTAWRMTKGHAIRVLRWVLVMGLIVGIAASVISTAVSLLFTALGLYIVGSVVAAAITGPFSVVYAIVLTLLVRLLSGPIEPPPPPELPAWMNAPSPPQPPATPPPATPPPAPGG